MQHVDEQYLDPKTDNCRVCNTLLDTEGWKLQSNPDVSMRECPACFSVCADRLPVDAFLSELYKPENYTPHLAGDDDLSKRAAKRLLKRIQPLLQESLSIVDFGGSDGNCARLLRKELKEDGYGGDISITVVDIFERPMEDGIRFLNADAFAEDKCKYNVIVG